MYILINEKKNLYVGYTKDLKRRVKEHFLKENNYTSKFKEWKLVYYEAYSSKEDAKERERRLKDGRARYLLKERIKNSIEEV